MNKQTENLNIALEEHRHDFVCSSLLQVMTFLEDQGFTFEEVLDGLANYAYINAKGGDTVCFLMKASLSLACAKCNNTIGNSTPEIASSERRHGQS
ncbi:MAG: hypothetical protein V7L26_15010 [Nostoc sp.]|uniref:hypothetical protein n=1 Tax=Nostoc sp. TaxID=1180 RepID=UPI002FEECD53